MSLLPLLNFAGGELDPKLHDKATLDKFRNGLATARNVNITKIGSVTTRFSTYNLRPAKNNNAKIKLYVPPNTDYLLEWGAGYVRVYYIEPYFRFAVLLDPRAPYIGLLTEIAHTLTENNLDDIHFTSAGDYVFIFVKGIKTLKLKLDGAASAFVPEIDVYKIPGSPNTITITPNGTPSGIPLQYMATVMVNGEESLALGTVAGYAAPVTTTQSNTIKVKFPVTGYYTSNNINEVRIYARPFGGGAYGLLGTTTLYSTVDAGANYEYVFVDYGYAADYNNGQQDIITGYGLDYVQMIDTLAKTGIVYQGRLLQVPSQNEEAIIASRPGYINNYFRDFPYASDSALLFKATRSGKAKVLRMLDHEGLIVFTTNGVYTSQGVLTVDNLALTKRGRWVISEKLPPLVVPGGVFFVDRTNTIRQLIYNDQLLGYESTEQSIFSNHIFKDRTIVSWAFQDGINPLITCVFDDGKTAFFTYNFEHKLSAWTRGDSKYPIEQVEGTDYNDISFFVVNKEGQRYIEVTLPRQITPEINKDYSGAKVDSVKILSHFAFMDSIKTYDNNLSTYYLGTTDSFQIAPVTPGNWSGNLNITTTDGFMWAVASVGKVLRWFNPEDLSWIDLTVVTAQTIGTDPIVVTPSEEFPSEYADAPNLYLTSNVITGLDHLNGEEVSVMVDGYLVSSPYNTVEGYPTVTVAGGSLTLPDGLKGAIVHVGRPIVADMKTLPATTVEQGPTTIESMTANKMYVKVEDSRGIYVGNAFPEEVNDEVDGTSVENMEALDESLVPEYDPLIGNKFLDPISKRFERVIPGSWNNQGSISFRQVDPLHFEIISVISDLEILNRSNK